MFFKTSNPSALAAWQKYQQDCQKVKDEAKRLEAVLNVACRSVFVSGISGFCFKGLRFMDDKYPFHRDLWRKTDCVEWLELHTRAHHVFPKAPARCL